MSHNPEKFCLNCKHPLKEEAFCPSCGQRTGVSRISFRETLSEFFSSTFSIEGPLLKTLWMLVRRPGRLFRDYLEGQRQRYYRPIPLFIVCTVLYVLVQSLTGDDTLKYQITVEDEVTLEEETKEAVKFMVAYINHILLFQVACLGLIAKLLFWKRYHLAEFIAVSFYITAFYLVANIVLLPASTIVHSLLKTVSFPVLVVYITLAFPGFLQDKRFRVYLKSFILSILSLTLYIILGFGFSLLVVLLQA